MTESIDKRILEILKKNGQAKQKEGLLPHDQNILAQLAANIEREGDAYLEKTRTQYQAYFETTIMLYNQKIDEGERRTFGKNLLIEVRDAVNQYR